MTIFTDITITTVNHMVMVILIVTFIVTKITINDLYEMVTSTPAGISSTALKHSMPPSSWTIIKLIMAAFVWLFSIVNFQMCSQAFDTDHDIAEH